MSHRIVALAFAPFLLISLACYGKVDGERAAAYQDSLDENGDPIPGVDACPRGQECASETPEGLIFYGLAFYDEGEFKLGPVLVGGTFEVSYFAGGPLADTIVDTSDSEVLTAEIAPLPEGRDVDGNVLITGVGQGAAKLSVYNSRGELHDRVSLDVYQIEDVEVSNVTEPERLELLAGCDEMLGVRLLANDGETTLRAFDASVSVTAQDLVLSPERWAWDCFRMTVPTDSATVQVDVVAGGETFVTTFDVRDLADGEECPEINRD